MGSRVNKTIKYLLTACLYTAAILEADIDYSSVGSQTIVPFGEASLDSSGPFTIEANYDWIGQSKFTSKRLRHDHIRFNEGQAEAGMVFYYDKECREGARFDLNYTFTNLDWKENPNFHESHFNTIGFSLGFLTNRLCRWLWKAQVRLNIDADHFNFNEYSTWDILFWGRYEYIEDVHIHLGFVALTGMKIDRIYPILGFDWRFAEYWKLNLVFPMNLSLKYCISQSWTASLAARFFDSRHRAGEHEPLPQSIWEYRNSGLELAIDYLWDPYLKVNLHGGTTFGGDAAHSDTPLYPYPQTSLWRRGICRRRNRNQFLK